MKTFLIRVDEDSSMTVQGEYYEIDENQNLDVFTEDRVVATFKKWEFVLEEMD